MATPQQHETVRKGVDMEAFEAFVEHATENPAEVQLELGARAHDEGRIGHSLAKVDAYELGGEEIDRETREYTYPMGAWKEVEAAAGFVSPTDRMEPIEVALAALTACVNVAVGMTALANEIDLESFETAVSLDFDPRVIFMVHDVDKSSETFENIDVEIEVDGDALTDEDLEVLTTGARRSPVWNLMRLAHDMEPAVSVAGSAASAD